MRARKYGTEPVVRRLGRWGPAGDDAAGVVDFGAAGVGRRLWADTAAAASAAAADDGGGGGGDTG